MSKKGFFAGLKRSLVTLLSVTMLATSLPSTSALAAELPAEATVEDSAIVDEIAETTDDAVVTEVEEQNSESEEAKEEIAEDVTEITEEATEIQEDVVAEDDEAVEEVAENENESVVEEEVGDEALNSEEKSAFKFNLFYADGAEVSIVSGNNPNYVYPLKDYALIKNDQVVGILAPKGEYGKNGATFEASSWYYPLTFKLIVALPDKKIKTAKFFKHGTTEELPAEVNLMGIRSHVILGELEPGEYDIQVEFEDLGRYNTLTLNRGTIETPMFGFNIWSDNEWFADSKNGKYVRNTTEDEIDFSVDIYNYGAEFVLKDSDGEVVEPLNVTGSTSPEDFTRNRYYYSILFDEDNEQIYTYDVVYKKANAKFKVTASDDVISFIVDPKSATLGEDGYYTVEDKGVITIDVVLDGLHGMKYDEACIDKAISKIDWGKNSADTKVTYTLTYKVAAISDDTIALNTELPGNMGGMVSINDIPKGTTVKVTSPEGVDECELVYTWELISFKGIGDRYDIELINEKTPVTEIKLTNPYNDNVKPVNIKGNKFSITADGTMLAADCIYDAKYFLYSEEHNAYYEPGKTINIGLYNFSGLEICKGENPVNSGSYTIKSGKTVVEEDDYYGVLYFDWLKKYAGKTLTFIYNTADGKSFTFYLKLDNTLTQVKLAGKTTGIVQSIGQRVAYPVTFNTGVNSVAWVSCDHEEEVEWAYDAEGKTLYVLQKQGEEGFIEDVKFTFADMYGSKVSVSIKFNNDLLINAIPTIKVISTTDIGTTVELGNSIINKYADDLNYGVSIEEVASGKPVANYDVPVSSDGQTTPIYLDLIEADLGKGHAAEFKVSVVLKKGNVSSKVTAVTISTKDPSYATSMKMKVLKSKVYAGEPMDYVAQAIFDKAASYVYITEYEIISSPKYDKAEYPEMVEPYIGSDESRVFMGCSMYTAPGTYTIRVKADSDETVIPLEATFKITVVNELLDFGKTELITSTQSIAKKANTKTTAKVKFVLRNYFGQVIKPKKIVYCIDDYANDIIYDAVKNKTLTISNSGVISVSPAIELSEEMSENKFGIGAMCITPGGKEYAISSAEMTNGLINIKEVSDEIDKIVIEGLNETDVYTTDKVIGKRIVALDKEGNEVPDVTYTVPGGKVTSDGTIEAIKIGSTAITVRTTDGGNKSKKFTVKTKYYSAEDIYIYSDYLGIKGEDVICNGESLQVAGGYHDQILLIVDGVFPAYYDNMPKVNLSVSVTGGKAKKNEDGSYALFIAKNKAVVNVKDATTKKTYSFTFENFAYNPDSKIKAVKTNKIYSNTENQKLTFNLNSNFDGLKLVNIEPASVNGYNAEDYYKLYNIFDNDKETTGGVLELSLPDSLAKGNYVFNAYFSGSGQPVGPVKVTVPVVDVPNANIKDIAVSAKKTDESVKVKISATNVKEVYCIMNINNINVKGHTNKFIESFEFGLDEGYLTVKPKAGTFDTIGVEDRTGYITIEAIDLSGKAVVKTVKVTVKVK